MEQHQRFLNYNRQWVEKMTAQDPKFFTRLAGDQKPEFLWIGCSDSRVPAEEITGARPGELFVHRNVANLIINTDFNLLSVLQFAIDVLKIKHVIVCGHYGCGGVKAALSRGDYGMINKWLRNIKDLYRLHEKELAALPSQDAVVARMIELNVIEQVENAAKISFVQRSWQNHGFPILHGWVYGLDTGHLKELVTLTPESKLHDIYKFEFPSMRP